MAADVQGRHEEGPAWFRADQQSRRVEWGGQGPGRYGGWLHVSIAEEGSSVTIHLSTDREEDAGEIRRSLSQALANIRSQVEGQEGAR